MMSKDHKQNHGIKLMLSCFQELFAIRKLKAILHSSSILITGFGGFELQPNWFLNRLSLFIGLGINLDKLIQP